MARPLELKHALGYGGDALHYAGGSSVFHAHGNTLKRLTWEGGAVSSRSLLAKGLGVGALAVHPEHSHFAMAERGQGALVSLCTHTADGDMVPTEIIEGAGSIDVDCMRFSADGAFLVTVSSLPEFQVAIWEWATNSAAPIATGTAPGEIKQVAFNPGNAYQLALLGGGILYLCNVVAGGPGEMELEFVTVPPPSANVLYVSMVWSEAGRLYATSSDGNLWNVDVQQNAVAGDCAVISADPAVECHLLAAHEHLICWCSDGSVAWIGLKTMVEGHRIKVPLRDGVTLVSACLAEGRFENMFLGCSAGSIYHLEVKQRMPDGSFEEDMDDPTPTNIKDVDVFCGEVQSCSHHALKRIVTSHGAHVNAVCHANTGDTIASAAQDGTVMIWDAVSGNPLATQRFPHHMTTLSPHPFEPLLAMGDQAGFVYILDIGMHQRLKCRFHVRVFRGPIAAVSFNADGSLLAVVAQNSNQLYLIALKDKTQEVMGYMEFPLLSSFVGSVRWAGSRHVVVADARGYLLACTDIPGKEGEALKLNAVFTGINTGQAGVGAFCNLGGQIVVAASKDKTVKAFSAQGWTRVITAQDLEGLAESAPAKQWVEHAKRVQALGTTGDMLATCSSDGSVHVHSEADLGSTARGVRVNSVWLGGSSAVAILRKGPNATVVACGGCNGSISILTDSPSALSGSGLATGAAGVSSSIADPLGEVVDADLNETTFVEKQLLADREMETALNAAKKNTFRDSIRRQKAALDELLQLNADAPEIERIPRDQIVVDHGMREAIIADGDARVLQTKAGITKQNADKETQMARIKTLAWDSMDVHGAELRGFQTDLGVFNYPIQKISVEETRQLKIIRAQRRMEIATASLQRKVMNQSISLIDLDNHLPQEQGEAAPAEGAAAEGDGLKAELTEDESEEAWRKRQHDPLLYHRLEVTTRERKTTQLILTEHVVRKVKAEFNGKFQDFLKKKGQSLGRIDEKMSRLLEINKELKSTEPVDKPGLVDSEQPEKVLVVEDSEIQVEKWVSPAEIRARDEEERRQREAASSDDTAERALNQMMGGSLAGESAVGKLDQVMVKPPHLIPAEGDELTEEGVKELKEWEAQYKAFLADQEAYARALDSEAKKLKGDMAEECKKFDESLQELAAQRMETDYRVYELELYKIKLMQAIAQEEDDLLVQRSLKHALEELFQRRNAAMQALDDYQQEVQGVEADVQATRDEGALLERQLIKEVVNGINVNNKELGDLVLRAYKKRSEMHELLDHGLAEDELERAHEHLQQAREHDALLEEQQVHLESMHAELEQLDSAAQQVQQSIDAAEAELEALELRMGCANSDLDLTLSVKQGQVEVEQAAVVTDYSDALVVERSLIEMHNTAIERRGSDKISVLHEIKDFRKGIHGLQWDNQRLDLEEEDLLQRTKDLQLLRVTKGLQSLIKGGDSSKDATEAASLEKLVQYQVSHRSARESACSSVVLAPLSTLHLSLSLHIPPLSLSSRSTSLHIAPETPFSSLQGLTTNCHQLFCPYSIGCCITVVPSCWRPVLSLVTHAHERRPAMLVGQFRVRGLEATCSAVARALLWAGGSRTHVAQTLTHVVRRADECAQVSCGRKAQERAAASGPGARVPEGEPRTGRGHLRPRERGRRAPASVRAPGLPFPAVSRVPAQSSFCSLLFCLSSCAVSFSRPCQDVIPRATGLCAPSPVSCVPPRISASLSTPPSLCTHLRGSSVLTQRSLPATAILQGTNTQVQQAQAQATNTSKSRGPPPRNPKEAAKMNMMVTHRKLLDLAKAQTREIELMREELVRLRARTFPSFAQLSGVCIVCTCVHCASTRTVRLHSDD